VAVAVPGTPIKTGQCVENGNRPLRQFETKVENGKLYARW